MTKNPDRASFYTSFYVREPARAKFAKMTKSLGRSAVIRALIANAEIGKIEKDSTAIPLLTQKYLPRRRKSTKENQGKAFSIRLTLAQSEKLDRMARALGISRNKVIEKLIAETRIQYDDQESGAPDALTTISQVRTWINANPIRPYLDAVEIKRAVRATTVKRVACAVLDILEEQKSLSAPMACRLIEIRAGASSSTVGYALDALTPWFLVREGIGTAREYCYRLTFRLPQK